MKQSEIDKAVNDWTDGFGGSTVEIAQLKKDVAAISFRAGAEMVNERQPYSREDMIDFGVELLKRTHVIANRFVVNANLKLWEETK